nr:MAG TPA: hypothetical protein [Caudoviricetes sp.]
MRTSYQKMGRIAIMRLFSRLNARKWLFLCKFRA